MRWDKLSNICAWGGLSYEMSAHETGLAIKHNVHEMGYIMQYVYMRWVELWDESTWNGFIYKT